MFISENKFFLYLSPLQRGVFFISSFSSLSPQQKWQLGVVFIPDSIGYFLGTSFTAGPSYRLGRWRAALLAMMLVALAAATVSKAARISRLTFYRLHSTFTS